jgi:hypothetical protein
MVARVVKLLSYLVTAAINFASLYSTPTQLYTTKMEGKDEVQQLLQPIILFTS